MEQQIAMNVATMIAKNWLLLDDGEEAEMLLRLFLGELAVAALVFFFFAMVRVFVSMGNEFECRMIMIDVDEDEEE